MPFQFSVRNSNGVTLGLERDVLAGERGVLPGGAVRVGLAAAHAGFGVHVYAGLCAHLDAHAHFSSRIAALALVLKMRLVCFQQDVAGRIQRRRVAGAEVALHEVNVAAVELNYQRC